MKKLLSTTALVLTMAFSGAAFAHSEWYGKEGQDDKPYYMDHALSKLPAEKSAEFRQTMKDSAEENKSYKEQIYKLHNELHVILTAPDFDKHAFISKRQELQKIHEEMEENKTEAFASAVSELSQNERMTLTRALDHDRKRHHGHHAAQVPAGNGRDASIQH